MYELENPGLRVAVLDPIADESKLGSRYCSGGYVWQITDARRGELLSGPRFPDPEPPPFDGQGLPEVFEIALGQDAARVGDDVWVIGVGRVRRESPRSPFHVRDNPTVVERTSWRVEAAAHRLVMRSRASFGHFGMDLVRTLELDGRRLISTTFLRNSGAVELPVRWFAHPFFPWSGAECCRFSLETALPENPGFFENARGAVERRPQHDWSRGCYVVPRAALGGELTVTQVHPALGEVVVRCRFPLAWLALWGNDRTLSVEPFHATVLARGAASEWTIEYRF